MKWEKNEFLELDEHKIYFTENISKKTAREIKDCLLRITFNKHDIFIDEIDGVTEINIAFTGKTKFTNTLWTELKLIADKISTDVFDGEQINLIPCDSKSKRPIDIPEKYMVSETAVTPTEFIAEESLTHGNCTLYFNHDISKKEARTVIDFLIESEYFNKDSEADILISKEKKAFKFKMIVRDEVDTNDDSDDVIEIKKWLWQLQEKIKPLKLVPIICKESFDNEVAILAPLSKNEISLLNNNLSDNKLEYHRCSLHFTNNLKKNIAKRLFDFLIEKEVFDKDNNVDIFADLKNDVVIIKIITPKENLIENIEYLNLIRYMGYLLQDSIGSGRIFGSIGYGYKLSIHLCDEYFNTQKTLKPMSAVEVGIKEGAEELGVDKAYKFISNFFK